MAAQYGFLLDMSGCIGCRTCSLACISENTPPSDVLWRRVREFISSDPNSLAYISMSCNHCDKPQCLESCPTSTYSKRPDGVVVQDHNRCIGCRMCIMACPYQAPVFDPVEGKTSKCKLCAERLDEGLIPRCVESCVANVLRFGKIEALRKEAQPSLSRIEERYMLPDSTISRPNIVIIPARPIP